MNWVHNYYCYSLPVTANYLIIVKYVKIFLLQDSVTGECETLYDISPLMKKELLNNPKLAPLVELSKDHDVNLTRVVKTKNYANCNLRSAYNFGFNHVPAGWEPGSNRMGEYLAVSDKEKFFLLKHS